MLHRTILIHGIRPAPPHQTTALKRAHRYGVETEFGVGRHANRSAVRLAAGRRHDSEIGVKACTFLTLAEFFSN